MLSPSLRLSREDWMSQLTARIYESRGCGDRRRGIDASGGGAVFNRDCDSRGMGAAEAGQRERSACQTGQADEAVLEAHADFIFGARAEAPDTTLDEMVER
jgi:hypothetical protein